MRTRLIYFLPLLLLLFVTNHSLEQTPNSTDDRPFYDKQVTVFESWLKEQKLDPYFVFKNPPYKIRRNKLILQLTFQQKGIDESVNAIRQLNDKYIEQTGLTLEHALFFKAIHLFDTAPENLQIKVKSIPNKGEAPGVNSLLRYKQDYADSTYFITSFSILRSEVKDTLVIKDYELPPNSKRSKNIQINGDASQIKDYCTTIKAKLMNYFEHRGKVDSVKPVRNNCFTLEVKDLKHEVIEEGILSIFDPYEKLTFTIQLAQSKDNSLKILSTIDGKYGPGIFKPKSNDYHEMHPEYGAQLKRYSDKFVEHTLYAWLTKN